MTSIDPDSVICDLDDIPHALNDTDNGFKCVNPRQAFEPAPEPHFDDALALVDDLADFIYAHEDGPVSPTQCYRLAKAILEWIWEESEPTVEVSVSDLSTLIDYALDASNRWSRGPDPLPSDSFKRLRDVLGDS